MCRISQRETRDGSQSSNDHHQGLAADLQTILARRNALKLICGVGSVAIATACTGGGEGTVPTATTTTTSSGGGSGSGTGSGGSTTSGDCVAYSAETNGPFPADGSNTANGVVANVLIESGVVKTDMTTSFAGFSGTATGVAMSFTITLQNVNDNCANLEGYAIYVWHCDRQGAYSVYEETTQNYLRAVGVTDANGQVTFESIFPGCYAGRWPHIHFEVYETLGQATHYDNRVLVSQFALPQDECSYVYSVRSDYGNSGANLSRLSIATDNIFSDNSAEEVAAQTLDMAGNDVDGYTATVIVGLAI